MKATAVVWLLHLFMSFSLSWSYGGGTVKRSLTIPVRGTTTSSRAEFFSSLVAASSLLVPVGSSAFDGGVGGLGKTRPQAGVVFRDEEAAASTTQSSSGGVAYELLAPDGSPAVVSFNAPWPLLQTAAGIESRDVRGGFESAFVQVTELQKGSEIKPSLLKEAIFSSKGKFGMYGSPTDIRLREVSPGDSKSPVIYLATFTTLTPAMRDSDRKAYISAATVGNGLFLLVTTTTAVRFTKLENSLRRVANSFLAVDAPKTNLRNQK
mmetsp:Transcript_20676/g.32355  ORF Transcript_20676/g.32355 Transcript_20676/m.32355 type:complete len:265 (-) Transcript_20676:1246-2040(-)